MSTPPNTPNSTLSEAVKGLPGLLDTLRSALESDADNQMQSKAFGLGCELLRKVVDSIAQDLSRIDEVQRAMSGFSISIPKDQFDRFIADEIRLLKKFGFSEQDLKGVEEGFTSVRNELDAPHFDSLKVVATLQEFRDLLCQLEDLAKKESIPNAKGLILTSISGVWQVAVVSGDVVTGVAGIPTGVLAIPAVLGAIASVDAGYKLVSRTIPKLRELIGNELTRRRQKKLKKNLTTHPVLKKNNDKK
jgi:hypothetical protein